MARLWLLRGGRQQRDRLKALGKPLFLGIEFAVRYLTVGFWFGLGFALAVAVIISLLGKPARAEGIPPAAKAYRAQFVSAARWEFGLDAPVAVPAAQAHQESGWRKNARSGVGAQGLAQIMPQTADWLARVRPDLGPPDVWHAPWAIRAMVAYDKWLLDRVRGHSPCDRWAKALSGYNGGLGWVYRDEDLAERLGFDRQDWWSGVALVNAGRSRANWDENRRYPERILKTLAPRYVAAGWGAGVCP